MKSCVFSVFDKAVNAYLPPFFARSKGEAIRSFSEACNKSDHQFYRHRLDYTLMMLGEFDDNSGLFYTVEPQRVLSAVECMEDPFTEETRLPSNGRLPI